MAALKGLTLTVLPPLKADASTARREKVIARLEEQKCLFADPNHMRTKRRWVTKDGERSLVEQQRKVSPWWRTAPDGSCVLFVRLGSQKIEFEKGKAGIIVGKPGALPATIDTIIGAVRAGELDPMLTQAAKRLGTTPKKV